MCINHIRATDVLFDPSVLWITFEQLKPWEWGKKNKSWDGYATKLHGQHRSV